MGEAALVVELHPAIQGLAAASDGRDMKFDPTPSKATRQQHLPNQRRVAWSWLLRISWLTLVRTGTGEGHQDCEHHYRKSRQ
ncbi:MAG: hypothetical protein ACJAZ8_000719 [Planctomycetota bacterium]|jgi:hypothetical protein